MKISSNNQGLFTAEKYANKKGQQPGQVIEEGETAMFKQSMLVFSALVLAACAQLSGGIFGDNADLTLDKASAETTGRKPAWDNAILTWAPQQYGSSLYEPVQIFYGDFTDDEATDALAWVMFPSGGNSDMLNVALFRNESGVMVYFRSADDIFGIDPRNVSFTPGRITLTSTMPRPGDPRCCPTGSQNWVIDTK